MMNPADQAQVVESRQPSEPPTLWVSLVAGSVLIHLLLLIAVSVALIRNAKVQLGAEPIAVEFVEPNAAKTQAGSTVLSQGTSSKAALAPRATQAAPQQPRPSVQSPIAPPEPQPSIAPQIATPLIPRSQPPLPQRSRTPFPRRNPTPPLTNPQPDPNAGQTVPPPAPDRTASSGRAIDTPSPRESQPPTPPDDSSKRPSGAPAPTNTATGSTTPSGNGSNSTEEPGLPGIPIDDRRGTSKGLQVTVSNPTSGNAGTDIVDQPARPKNNPESLPDIPYPPIVGLNFGRSVELEVRVNREGTVETVTVLSSGAAQEYNDFVKDLVKEMSFEPALTKGIPVTNLIKMTIEINALK